MALAYSPAEKTWAGRKLAMVVAAHILMRTYVLSHIPEGVPRASVGFAGFLFVGITLFRTMQVRGWSYRWVMGAHVLWVLATCFWVVFGMVTIAFVQREDVHTIVWDAPHLESDELSTPEPLRGLALLWNLRQDIAVTLALVSVFCYLAWSCVSVGRSRHDYGMPQPTDEADSAQSSSYELREI